MSEAPVDLIEFSGDQPALGVALVRPQTQSLWASPGVIAVPGFPTAPGGGANSFVTYPTLAERISESIGATACAIALRGLPESEGSFSPQGWIDDVCAAVDWLCADDRISGVRLLGFGTGGAICLRAAVGREAVTGVITAGAPADLSPWVSNPGALRDIAAQLGITEHDADVAGWAEALESAHAERCAAEIGDKDLLVLHGLDDHAVLPLSARAIADAHGNADLRMLEGGSHHLRHDPRAIAIICGWLERRHRAVI